MEKLAHEFSQKQKNNVHFLHTLMKALQDAGFYSARPYATPLRAGIQNRC